MAKQVKAPAMSYGGGHSLGEVAAMLGRSTTLIDLFVKQGKLHLDERNLVSVGELRRFLGDPEVAKTFDDMDAPARTPHPGSTLGHV